MVQYIHVIILNNNTVFLHASLLTSYDKNEVLLECELMNIRSISDTLLLKCLVGISIIC